MFGATCNGANAYAKVGIDTGVVAASPHHLIVMLFEGAVIAVMSAQKHMLAGDIALKGSAISKAISIIDDGLRASLDKKIGGQIALSLDSLYEYMSRQLFLANLKNDIKKLDEVKRLLTELKTAWETIGATPAMTATPAVSAAGTYASMAGA